MTGADLVGRLRWRARRTAGALARLAPDLETVVLLVGLGLVVYAVSALLDYRWALLLLGLVLVALPAVHRWTHRPPRETK